jgi:hypothetical protein
MYWWHQDLTISHTIANSITWLSSYVGFINLPNNSERWIWLLFPLYRWGNWGSERYWNRAEDCTAGQGQSWDLHPGTCLASLCCWPHSSTPVTSGLPVQHSGVEHSTVHRPSLTYDYSTDTISTLRWCECDMHSGKKKSHFQFWTWIFSQASDMWCNPFCWCWLATATSISQSAMWPQGGTTSTVQWAASLRWVFCRSGVFSVSSP